MELEQDYRFRELVSGGDCRAHYHLEDRVPTQDFLHGLQNVAYKYEVSSDTVLTGQEDFIFVDTSASNVTITLPRATGGREITVVKTTAAHTLTVDTTGTDLIDGSASQAYTTQWLARTYKQTPTGWTIVWGYLDNPTPIASQIFPNIGAYYYPEQYAPSANTPTVVKWGGTTSLYGFTLNANNTATATYAGIYKITYSLELANDDNAAHDVVVWLRLNGDTSADDIENSTTIFTLPARKSAGIPSYICAYSEVVFQLAAGDSVGLWWGTDQAATSGGALGTWMYARAAQTSPMPYPETPSAIGSITFVSAIP